MFYNLIMRKGLIFLFLALMSLSCVKKTNFIYTEEIPSHPCISLKGIDQKFSNYAPLKSSLCFLERGEYKNALNILRENPESFVPVSDYVYLIYAIALYEAGLKSDALTLLNLAYRKYAESPLSDVFKAFGAVVEKEEDNFSDSLSRIAFNIEQLPRGPLRWYINYNFIRLVGREKSTKKINLIINRFIKSSPPYNYILSLYYYNLIGEKNIVEWVRSALYSGRKRDVIRAYFEIGHNIKKKELKERFLFYSALAFFLTGKYRKSEKIFKKVLSSNDQNIAAGSLFYLARIYYRTGRKNLTVNVFNNVYKLYPFSKWAPLALYKIMELAEEKDKIVYLKRIVEDYPDSEIINEVNFLLGFYEYYLGNRKESLKYLNRVFSSKNAIDNKWEISSTYWYSRINTEITGEAKFVKEFINQNYLSEYYILAKCDIMGENIKESPEVAYDFSGDDHKNRITQRFLVLKGLNLKKFLKYEIDWFLLNHPEKETTYNSLLSSSLFPYSIRNFVKTFKYPYRISEITHNPSIYRFLFPRPFTSMVNRCSERYKIDPNLIYAIIHQESHFDKSAFSSAGAMGLMQLMPSTALNISKLIGIEAVDNLDLYNISINIGLGCRYLRMLLDEFYNNIPLALAAYNGGAHNVKRWLRKKKPGRVDEFIELIGFPETKRYVKRVLKKYLAYTVLYGGEIQAEEIALPPSLDM